MTYTTIELRSIANALIFDGQELVTGMERSEVRDYLLYPNWPRRLPPLKWRDELAFFSFLKFIHFFDVFLQFSICN